MPKRRTDPPFVPKRRRHTWSRVTDVMPAATLVGLDALIQLGARVFAATCRWSPRGLEASAHLWLPAGAALGSLGIDDPAQLLSRGAWSLINANHQTQSPPYPTALPTRWAAFWCNWGGWVFGPEDAAPDPADVAPGTRFHPFGPGGAELPTLVCRRPEGEPPFWGPRTDPNAARIDD
jgi:hypothetical protein